MDPRTMTGDQLQASRFTPMMLVGMNGAQRERLAPHYPANLLATGGPDPVATAVEVTKAVAAATPAAAIAGAVTGADPGGVVSAAGGVVSTVSSLGSNIAGSVLGPIAEVAFGVVIAAAGVALVVWALVALGKQSSTVTSVVKVGAKAGAAAAGAPAAAAAI